MRRSLRLPSTRAQQQLFTKLKELELEACPIVSKALVSLFLELDDNPRSVPFPWNGVH